MFRQVFCASMKILPEHACSPPFVHACRREDGLGTVADHSNERLGILQEKTLAAFFDRALSCSGTYVVQQPPLSVTADFCIGSRRM